MGQHEVDLLIGFLAAIIGLVQTVINIGFKLRQDAMQSDHEALAADLKSFADKLRECLEGDKQVQ